MSQHLERLPGTLSDKPLSCSGVRVQVPSPLLVPADKTASSGMPATVTDSVNRTVKFQYDTAGRTTHQTLPDS